jgi:predicted lipoprotein with Yx(FWY)xxD motif
MATTQPAKIESTATGDVLAAPGGKTLYVFDGDKIDFGQTGKSSCNGECAQRWRPFSAGTETQPIREDGSRQWSYKGRPVYTGTGDTAPGQLKWRRS